MAVATKKVKVSSNRASAEKKALKKTAATKAAKAGAAKKAGPASKAGNNARVKASTEVKVSGKAGGKKTVEISSTKKALQKKITAARKPGGKLPTSAEEGRTKKISSVVAHDSDRFRGLKSMLIARREALLREAQQEIQKYVSGENRQLVDTAIDEADWAAVEISEDINLKRLSAQRQVLNDVNECLRKLNEGTYGICEDCGEDISEKRLKVIPTATLCIECKEQREKMAILEQDTEI